VTPQAAQVRRTYLTLTLLSTLASSLIWGINTLFLLSAGLSNTEAFAANAFYAIGEFVFEVPTGIVADTKGRRTSYLLGTVTLLVSTLLYLLMWQTQAPLWGWAIASILLGLGFTFFSGATDAWLVDALRGSGYDGDLDSVFARGQVMSGIAMLTGTVAGGFIAQTTSLAVPYIVRAVLLGVVFVVAFLMMHDIGFSPRKMVNLRREVQTMLADSISISFGNRYVRWLILSAPFVTGVGFYAFYAMQPYLLELFGNQEAYGVAGLAAAVFSGSQIVGGWIVPYVRRILQRRTTLLLGEVLIATLAIALIGLAPRFWPVLVAFLAWAIVSSIAWPVRRAFLNGCISSERRATVLSFDALMGSAGGAAFQPLLGRVADARGYPASYLVAAALHAVAIPFLYLARRQDAPGEFAGREPVTTSPPPAYPS